MHPKTCPYCKRVEKLDQNLAQCRFCGAFFAAVPRPHYVPTLDEVLAAGYSEKAAKAIIEEETAVAAGMAGGLDQQTARRFYRSKFVPPSGEAPDTAREPVETVSRETLGADLQPVGAPGETPRTMDNPPDQTPFKFPLKSKSK